MAAPSEEMAGLAVAEGAAAAAAAAKPAKEKKKKEPKPEKPKQGERRLPACRRWASPET